MNNSFRRSAFGFVLFFSSLLALGFFVGRKDSSDSKRAPNPIVQDKNGSQRQIVSPSQDVSTKKKSPVIPTDLKNLNGKEFVDSLPALESLAEHGDWDAVHVLIHRLGSCSNYQPTSDEEIREKEESNYRRELDAVRTFRARRKDLAVDPRFSDESVSRSHEAALKSAFDERDLCTSLTPRQIEGRLEWIRVSLERHDRQTILDAALPGGGVGSSGIERVRNAEKLNEIAQMERVDLDALIATGDVTALERAAYAFANGSNSLLQRDAAQAYAYAYAWVLTDSSENAWQKNAMKELMERLANGDGFFPALTSTEVDEARARGLALFQSCCASGVHH